MGGLEIGKRKRKIVGKRIGGKKKGVQLVEGKARKSPNGVLSQVLKGLGKRPFRKNICSAGGQRVHCGNHLQINPKKRR